MRHHARSSRAYRKRIMKSPARSRRTRSRPIPPAAPSRKIAHQRPGACTHPLRRLDPKSPPSNQVGAAPPPPAGFSAPALDAGRAGRESARGNEPVEERSHTVANAIKAITEITADHLSQLPVTDTRGPPSSHAGHMRRRASRSLVFSSPPGVYIPGGRRLEFD